MKLIGMAFSKKGAELCSRLARQMEELGHEFQACAAGGHGGQWGLTPVSPDLKTFTAQAFSQADGLVFIGACGIAVRAIAPLIRSKTKDPAVVVIDEQGRYAISLLSGHLGGANDLAILLAQQIEAEPVVTTATDGRRLFAVDSFAKKKRLTIESMKLAREISAALLDGETVGVYSDYPIDGRLPKGLALREEGRIGLCISIRKDQLPFERTLLLIPAIVTLGIGCKKGVSCEQIETAVGGSLRSCSILKESIGQVCSIDLKEREPGLLEFCRKNNLPFRVYSSSQLSAAPGSFTSSEFVKGVTGVDNICERSAVLGASLSTPGGRLIMNKQAGNGVTVAAAVLDWRIQFED